MATSTLGSGTLVLAGTTSGTTTVTATAVAGTTTLTLPAATDTLVGKATTDTLTNKTLTGAVMNGTLGATTPSTGAFTTLSATGVTTVQAGTAALPAITTTGDTNTGIFFPAADTIAFSEGGAEAMRIDSSGNMGIGTNAPATKIEIKGSGVSFTVNNTDTAAYATSKILFNNTSVGSSIATIIAQRSISTSGGFLIFNTNTDAGVDTERVRIDSSGNLMVGTPNASGKSRVVQTANDIAFRVDMTNTGMTNQIIYVTCNTAEGAGYTVMTYRNENAARDDFIIFGNGNVQNRNNSYAGISDIKLKENIVDATPKLADLMQVKVRTYNLIGDTQKQIGVVAQELEEVFPSLVEESPDREMRKTVDEDGNETESMFDLGTTTKSVKYSVFVPMLIKAIQEQQALITQLQADVAALKGA